MTTMTTAELLSGNVIASIRFANGRETEHVWLAATCLDQARSRLDGAGGAGSGTITSIILRRSGERSLLWETS